MDPRFFYSVQAALLFLIISSPILYNFVQRVVGRFFTVAIKGCPTVAGLVLHSVVFALVTYLFMVLQEPKPAQVVIPPPKEVKQQKESFVASQQKESFVASQQKESFVARNNNNRLNVFKN